MIKQERITFSKEEVIDLFEKVIGRKIARLRWAYSKGEVSCELEETK